MRLAFVSNFLSGHQQPLCEALSSALGADFRFIATTPVSKIRAQMGWPDCNSAPFVIRAYADDKTYQNALEYVAAADAVILGHDQDDSFFKAAIKQKHTIVYRCTERLYKRGRWRAISPRGLYHRWNTYFRYPRGNQYLLCSSAYAAKDYALLGAFFNRSFKWGYFPQNKQFDIEQALLYKHKGSIFWAGRMLDWKHPEIPVLIAKRLREKGIPFELDMAGDGPLLPHIQRLVQDEGLEKNVHLLGNLLPSQVRDHMRTSQIFLATSDYQEGWGAVVNEAMSEGCAVVACKAMGAVPYLIQTGVNGYSYGHMQTGTACLQAERLLADETLRCRIARAAYHTIQNEWNAQCAAERLLRLSAALRRGEGTCFSSGPCSKADLI